MSDKELATLAETMVKFGGKISSRKSREGNLSPYEINIAAVNAFSGDAEGLDQFSFERFMCAHAIMLGLEGVPAIYINSFFGTKNDYDRLEKTKINRSINRHRWNKTLLESTLSDKNGSNSRKFESLKYLIKIEINIFLFFAKNVNKELVFILFSYTLFIIFTLFYFFNKTINIFKAHCNLLRVNI